MASYSTEKSTKSVAVIGTGLAGCLAALGIANKFGWAVDIYDARSATDKAIDDRRAINLAMSARGLRAIEDVDPDLSAEMVRIGVPLHGRMIHDYKGSTSYQAYSPHNEAILSINRFTMIAAFKEAMAASPLIKTHFSHKLVKSQGTEMEFENPLTGDHVKASADLIIGADGAYSALREQMRRVIKMDMSTRWAPLSYMKIEVAPKTLANGEKTDAFDPSVLHVWPRKDFLLIAPSNADKTFTCVLWATDALLERLREDEKFTRKFFPEMFPSFMPAISIEDVIAQLKANPVVPMCSMKCSPLHDEHRVLIGDAAHVIVPYLGHGANVGYEDVRLLLGCLGREPNQKAALDTYSKMRQADLDAIDYVSWAHVQELSEHVLQFRYVVRKWLDFTLARAFPGKWVPLYSAITFDSETSYADVVKRDRRQARIVSSANVLLIALLVWTMWTMGSAFVPQSSQGHWMRRPVVSYRAMPSDVD